VVDQDLPENLRRRRRRWRHDLFLDEAGFSSEPSLGKTYGLKGQTPWSTPPGSDRSERHQRRECEGGAGAKSIRNV